MEEVAMGMNKLSKKFLAIKSVNKEYLLEEKQNNKVMQEFGIVLRMRHLSVIKLLKTFEAGKDILWRLLLITVKKRKLSV
jgi:hypothetical protein